MGGVGSGNWRANSSQPSDEKIEAARVELSRLVARANREGRSLCECPTETLRFVLFGIVAAQAEVKALVHDLERSMTRENNFLNEPAGEILARLRESAALADEGGGISLRGLSREERRLLLSAQADRNPEGHDPAEGHGRNDESPVGNADAPQPKSSSQESNLNG